MRHLWTFMDIYGHHSFMDIYRHLQTSYIYGHLWTFMDIYGGILYLSHTADGGYLSSTRIVDR